MLAPVHTTFIGVYSQRSSPDRERGRPEALLAAPTRVRRLVEAQEQLDRALSSRVDLEWV